MGEFAGAGQKAGLEIWRIEKMVPTLWPEDKHGKFHSGDAYIVLNTKAKSAGFEWDIHFWLGKESSQDEQGVAAYKTVELDESLGGGPVQYREVEGHESEMFQSLFRGGIEYLEGGVDSGFKHVEKDSWETRLLQLKGKRNVRCTTVDLSAGAMNHGDVFILDAGLQIWQWNGNECSRNEKAKGLDVTLRINNNERGGRANVEIVEDGSEPAAFWEALGGGSNSDIKSAADGGDDSGADKKSPFKLHKVSDAGGSLEVSEVATAPLSHDMLDTNDCFIVETDDEIFVWVGAGATKDEKLGAMKNATGFLEQANKPSWTPISRCSEGAESSQFKGKFKGWPATAATSSNVAASGPVSKADVKALHRKQAAEKQSLVDDGSGKLQIWRVEDFKKVDVPQDLYGQFYGGDSYVLLYTYMNGTKEEYIIYFWLGSTSSQDETGAAALLAKELDDDMGGAPVQVRVVQNKEPDHFLTLFKGKMIVHEGGKASGFKNREDADSYDTDGISLFHVRGTNDLNTRGVQVPELASSLNSGDAFVLLTPNTMFVWFGNGANDDEKACARKIADVIKGSRSVEELAEGSEPDAFWEALGGKGEYPSDPWLGDDARDPRLFECSNASGSFDIEEIFNFAQDDLSPDDIFMLDTFTEVYVWVGDKSNITERKEALKSAIDYVASAEDGRDADTPILQVHAGHEPPMFTCHFLGWDPVKAASLEDPYEAKKRALGGGTAAPADARQVAAQLNRDTYPYEELLKRPPPEGVDATRLQSYLSDEEFQTVFGMAKADFEKLPAWKQNNKKKEVNLF